MTLFLATGLEPIAEHEPDPDERIEIVAWPLAELDARDRRVRRLEDADRAAAARGAGGAVVALHRQGRRAAGRNRRHGDRRPQGRGAQTDAHFEALVLDFLAYLEFERGLARNTLDAYRTDLLQFGAFLAARGRDATEVERADVADFLADLATGVARRRGRQRRPRRRARRRRSAARPPACAPSTATCAARS